MLNKNLLNRISVFTLTAVMAISSLNGVSGNAKNDESIDGINQQEFEIIKNVANESNLDSRKEKLNNEVKKTKNTKLKEFLNTKIAVSFDEKIDGVKIKTISKYDNLEKNYGCYSNSGSKGGYNNFGNELFRFYIGVSYCADYSRVYNGSVSYISGSTYAPGVSYYGEAPAGRNYERYAAGYTEYIPTKQGLFKTCISYNFSCIYEYRPWIEFHATREGNYVDYVVTGF
jgi:hypothetical protein